jgi:hypothetical protein
MGGERKREFLSRASSSVDKLLPLNLVNGWGSCLRRGGQEDERSLNIKANIKAGVFRRSLRAGKGGPTLTTVLRS